MGALSVTVAQAQQSPTLQSPPSLSDLQSQSSAAIGQAKNLQQQMQNNPKLQQYLAQNPQAAQQVQSLQNMQSATKNGQMPTAPQTTTAQQPNTTAAPTSSQSSTQSTSNSTGQSQSSSQQGAKNGQQGGAGSTLTPQQQEAMTNKQAFKAVMQSAFPMSVEQIQKLHNTLDDTQRVSAASPYNSPPQPTSSSLFVNLSPGSTPPVIRLSKGFVSSLVFIDDTGAPWPITAYDLGDPTSFNITWNKKDNTIMVQALTTYVYGNLAVRLKGLETPVMLTLVPGQKIVDYRVDLRIQGTGPEAHPSIQSVGLPSAANPQLLNFLDGVPPKGSQRLKVTGDIAEAWLFNNQLFIRTQYNVLSPAWLDKMSSADGMNAYAMQKTPLILMSRHGKAVQVKITGL